MTFYLHKASGIGADAQPWSFGLVSSGSVSEAAAQTTWAAAVDGFFTTTAVAALYSTAVSITATSTSTASPLFKQTTKTSTLATHAGTATTQELPSQVAMVVTIRSAASTKSGHGRLFLPAPVAAALAVGTGGHLSAGSVTTLSTALGVMFTALVTGGLSPLILTRRKTINGQGALTTQQVTAIDMPNKLAIQRRRGDKIIPVRTTVSL
jgi:hypothetical protein